MAGKPKDLTGKRFGRLVVCFRLDGPRAKSVCKCDCGNITSVKAQYLNSGAVRSCGCRMGNRGSKYSGDQLSLKYSFAQYKHGAKRRGLSFSIGIDEFKNLTSSNCFYCDRPPNNPSTLPPALLRKYKDPVVPYLSNGIDRKNNTLGYVVENCVPCCRECNFMKQNVSLPDFIDQILKISKKFPNGGLLWRQL